MARPRRVLFLAEGITMAHFTRPASLAATLQPDTFEVHFRTPSRFHGLVPEGLASVANLPTIPPASFLDALSKGRVLYTEEALAQYVRDDLELLDEVNPDLVIGDYRLSLAVSARLRKVPFGSIFNAYWSPYADHPAIVPALGITQWIPAPVLNPVFGLIRPAIYARHAAPINRLCRANGLPPISRDLRFIYTAGDLVLYPETPELVPLVGAPPHHHFIGTCPWSGPLRKPVWWDEAFGRPEPKILVALGSSGPIHAIPAIMTAIAAAGAVPIVVTSGRPLGGAIGSYVAEFLPYDEALSMSSAVVSHGGSSAVYPALTAGTPTLALPANIDTHLSTAVLERTGAGLAVRVEDVSPTRLERALRRLIVEPEFRAASAAWSQRIRVWDTRKLFPELLTRYFGAELPS